MKTNLIIVIVVAVAGASFGAVPVFYDDFESLYADGQPFVTATNGWQASSAAAYVTNSGGYGNSRAVFMDGTVALTNTVSADANLKVWTDVRIKPMLGMAMDNPPTNASSLYCYFNTNGALVVATASGWLVCTNDVWGHAVPPATNNAYLRLSVFQDFSVSNQAVLLNDQLIVQDLRFAGPVGAYNNLSFENADSNCWVDNVWVKTNVSGLVSNRNNDAEALPEAEELQRYGYARRTLYVSQTVTNGVPLFATLQAAVNAWRPRDTIYVYGGLYAEDVTIASNVVLEGQGFSVNNLSVAAGAAVAIAQSVNCVGTLALTGQVDMASGASLTSATAHVAGTLALSGGGAFVVASLDVGASGQVTFSNAQLVANAAGVVMNGTFALSNTWGSATLVSLPLPFSDDWELYAHDTVVTNLKFRGWSASDGTVKVQTNAGVAGSKAVVLPDVTSVSSSITSAATKVWTDYYVKPTLGLPPAAPATNVSSFLAYADTNGYLVVATGGGGWHVCSNQVDGAPPPLLQSNGFARISVLQNYGVSPRTFAVFVAGNLVAQGLTFPASLTRYSGFAIDNQDGAASADNVLITAAVPPGLTNDLDHDGIADAIEIDLYGDLSAMPRGAVFRFR
jgi:hypothetical protein